MALFTSVRKTNHRVNGRLGYVSVLRCQGGLCDKVRYRPFHVIQQAVSALDEVLRSVQKHWVKRGKASRSCQALLKSADQLHSTS